MKKVLCKQMEVIPASDLKHVYGGTGNSSGSSSSNGSNSGSNSSSNSSSNSNSSSGGNSWPSGGCVAGAANASGGSKYNNFASYLG
jgi:hypothetical protein